MFKSVLKVAFAVFLFAVSTPSYSETVIEFYNSKLDDYFITADTAEITAIDNGSAGAGWVKTGYSFETGLGTTPVCRFSGFRTHLYTIDAQACEYWKTYQGKNSWHYEGIAFYTTPPTNQTCPSNTIPVYRAYYNKRNTYPNRTSNIISHQRIISSLTAIQEVVARGWTNEGVVMCVIPEPEAVTTCDTTAYASPYFAVGDYSISNNTWGKGDIPDSAFHQCISGAPIISGGVQTGISAYVEWDWPTYGYGADAGTIKSDPAIRYRPSGKDMTPIALSNIGNLTVNYDITITDTGGHAVFFDMVLDSTTTGQHRWNADAVVSIMLNYTGSYVPPLIDVQYFDGVLYDISFNLDATGVKLFQFTRTDQTQTMKGSIAVKPFYDYLIGRGLIPSTYSLDSIDIYSEVFYGAGSTAFNSYSVTW